MLNKSVMLEYLYVRDSAVLCDRLIQSLMNWEEVTGEKLSDDIKITLDHLLKTLRRGEAELIDEICEDIERLEANSVGRKTMSEKKCKMCGDRAEWQLDGECYCEFCARVELDVHGFATPRRCEMCGDTLERVYYTDGECNAFCSSKCALEYNDACEIEKEQEDGGQENNDG